MKPIIFLLLLSATATLGQMAHECKPGQECCSDAGNTNPDETDGGLHCDVLVADEFLEVNNGDDVSLTCDPHVHGIYLVTCRWITPTGVECK